MIVKPETIKKIKEYFNLNLYEAKVWIALLTKGIASAREISEISGVPRSRTYDVLESLEKRGFAVIKIGKPVKYIAVKPVEVLEKIKILTLQEAQEKVKMLSNLKETKEYEEIVKIHKIGVSPIKSHEITGAIKGRSNILSKIRDIVENAEKEILICTSVKDFEDKGRVLIPLLEKINEKNIKVKVALSGEEDKIKKISNKFNINIKNIENSPRFFISDKKQALLMITPENIDEEMGVWLNSEFFTQSLQNIVEKTLINNKN